MDTKFTKASSTCYEVYKIYKNILNCYMSDYYVENHWDKLSDNWKCWLKQLPIEQIASVLDYDCKSNQMLPLTVICIRQIIHHFCVNRKKFTNNYTFSNYNALFEKVLYKKIKQKKRHEIDVMCEICYKIALEKNCFNIVDVGSGLGHLSRKLAYQYGFNICTIEANDYLSSLATKLDMDFERLLISKKIPHSRTERIIHINRKIEDNSSTDELFEMIKNAFKFSDSNFKFGIIGLHCCGNLGSTLLKFYNNCPNAVFINLVSCCYMKLSFEDSLSKGYPLSNYYQKYNYCLDYESCELACHAIENYIKKISTSEYYFMKIHAYRAGLEQVIVDFNRNLRHSRVGNVKFDNNCMNFETYCNKAKLGQLDLILPKCNIKNYEKLIEESWDQVVKFYCVRLLLAPVVESIILYDRLIFLYESNSFCEILPAFDPNISPRNQILTACKR